MPARQELERKFAKKLGKLSAKHAREIRKLLGDPPDIGNVPEEFWTRVERETEEEAAAALLIILLLSARSFAAGRKATLTPEDLLPTNQTLYQHLEQVAFERAQKIGAGVVHNARRGLTGASATWRQRAAVGKDINDVLLRTSGVFGPGRVATIARTETTGAKFAGEEAAAQQIIGPEAQGIWILGPCRHCEFCPLIAGTGREFWSQFVSRPPAHVNCCCRIQWTRTDATTKRPPPVASVRLAMELSGVFGF